MVRRLVWDQDRAGSIPVTPMIDAVYAAGKAARYYSSGFFVNRKRGDRYVENHLSKIRTYH